MEWNGMEWNGMEHNARIRSRIAQETARIFIEEGLEDYLVAKQKAAKRLGHRSVRNLPRNSEGLSFW